MRLSTLVNLIFTLSLLLNACIEEEEIKADDPTKFTDSRDDKTYNIVEIGDQIWFAENLNYQIGNSWCYDNNMINCHKYGRLYDWQSAFIACPTGWHLPSYGEWLQLIDYLGGETVAGDKLKSQNDWFGNGNGTNESNFTGLPAGYRYQDGSFQLEGGNSYWWTSTDKVGLPPYPDILVYGYSRSIMLDHRDGKVHNNIDFKLYGFSCRCLKD